VQVSREAGEPDFVHEHFAAFETVPVAIWCGFRDAEVYPARWDFVGEFVVKNCLEGGYDLEVVRVGMK